MAVTVRAVSRPIRGLWEQVYILAVLRGLGVTFRHFFVNLQRHVLRLLGLRADSGAVTIQYPDEPAVLGRRARTRHRLLARADGSPRCTACLLCETICPAKCIHIIAEDSPDVAVEKRARSFESTWACACSAGIASRPVRSTPSIWTATGSNWHPIQGPA